MNDAEFEEKCLKKRTITILPTVTTLKEEEQIKALAQQHKSNSEYFLQGAKSLLKSDTPLLAILIGYFAMEHKANQIIALQGYKVESHVCTQMALSRILEKKDWARKLSEIFGLRQTIGYRMSLKHSPEEKKNAEDIVLENVIPFIKEIDALIEKI